MKCYLENTIENHNKFYELWSCGFKNQSGDWNRLFLNIRFGKIGTDGKTIIQKFQNLFDLQSVFDKKVREKIRKGYRINLKKGLDFIGTDIGNSGHEKGNI